MNDSTSNDDDNREQAPTTRTPEPARGSNPMPDPLQLASGIAAYEAKEFRRAWQMLQPLADLGDADALYRCAIMAQNGLGVVPQPESAIRMMQLAAEQDFALAKHALGVMYVFGEGVEADSARAIPLLQSAGESGLAGAWTTLGMLYNEGRGVPVDKERAREYYRRAGFDPDELV